MKKLMKNKKGFTLIEMLIVVAIIVILVAVSVPAFTANLEKASSATDEANMRAAKAAAVAYMIDNDIPAAGVYYDAEDGVIETTKPSDTYGQVGTAKGKVIKITSSSGSLVYTWD